MNKWSVFNTKKHCCGRSQSIVVKRQDLFTSEMQSLNIRVIANPSRMEQSLGLGRYNAMPGHSEITARFVQTGLIKIDDNVWVELEQKS